MTDELRIGRKIIIDTYTNADDKGKALLESMFSKNDLIGSIFDRISTFSEACKEVGESEANYELPANASPKEMADAYYKRLELLERVFNQGWIADLADTTQKKFYAWANIIPDASRPFGFRFSFDACGYDDDASGLGARPYIKDSETAIYVFKTFTSEYEGWMYYLNLSKQKQQ